MIPKKGKILVEFTSKTCAPCKIMQPLLQEIKQEHKINVLVIDVKDHPKPCVEHGVMGVPTLILFEDGVEVKRQVGALSKKELNEFIGDVNTAVWGKSQPAWLITKMSKDK
jgi:thioredoxin 1